MMRLQRASRCCSGRTRETGWCTDVAFGILAQSRFYSSIDAPLNFMISSSPFFSHCSAAPASINLEASCPTLGLWPTVYAIACRVARLSRQPFTLQAIRLLSSGSIAQSHTQFRVELRTFGNHIFFRSETLQLYEQKIWAGSSFMSLVGLGLRDWERGGSGGFVSDAGTNDVMSACTMARRRRVKGQPSSLQTGRTSEWDQIMQQPWPLNKISRSFCGCRQPARCQ